MAELSESAQVLGDFLLEKGIDAVGMIPSELVIQGRKFPNVKKLCDEVIEKDILDSDRPAKERVEESLKDGVLTKIQLEIVLEKIVTRAVKKYALNCGIEEVEIWAKKWLSGEDRSKESAEAAEIEASETEVTEAAEAATWAAIEAASWKARWGEARWVSIAAVRTAFWAMVEADEEQAEIAEIVEYEQQIEDIRSVLREED